MDIMINKYTLKHLLHQPEKIIKAVTPTSDKIPKPKILPFPQIINKKDASGLIENRTTKFVVHRPNHNNSTSYSQKNDFSNPPQTMVSKLNISDITIRTEQITETFASMKTKCFNYFNEKAS